MLDFGAFPCLFFSSSFYKLCVWELSCVRLLVYTGRNCGIAEFWSTVETARCPFKSILPIFIYGVQLDIFPHSLSVGWGYVTMFSPMESKQLSILLLWGQSLNSNGYTSSMLSLFSLGTFQNPTVAVTQLQLCRKWWSLGWWESNDLKRTQNLSDREDQSCPIDQDNKLWDWSFFVSILSLVSLFWQPIFTLIHI